MKIAFLGLGKMGTAVARLLLKTEHELTVWNRTPDRARPLAEAGAKTAASLAAAVDGRDVVLTMLADDAATEAAVFGGENLPGGGILDAMAKDAVHVSLSTISVRLSRRLEEAHQARGQHFVAAPVFGRPMIAEQGKLWIAAAGNDAALARVRPLLEAASRGLTVVSNEPWRAHALKLGGNAMISAMVQAISEGFVFASAQGIDPALFLETVNSALFQSPFFAQYGKTMLNPPEHPGATILLGHKDTELARQAAAEVHRQLPLLDLLAAQFDRAIAAGMKDEDWAVGQYRITERMSQPASSARVA